LGDGKSCGGGSYTLDGGDDVGQQWIRARACCMAGGGIYERWEVWQSLFMQTTPSFAIAAETYVYSIKGALALR
jgi:hypothetical protein